VSDETLEWESPDISKARQNLEALLEEIESSSVSQKFAGKGNQ